MKNAFYVVSILAAGILLSLHENFDGDFMAFYGLHLPAVGNENVGHEKHSGLAICSLIFALSVANFIWFAILTQRINTTLQSSARFLYSQDSDQVNIQFYDF